MESNYLYIQLLCVITLLCANLNGNLAKPHLGLFYESAIISHKIALGYLWCPNISQYMSSKEAPGAN